MGRLLTDLRYATRSLARSPLFTAGVVLTLGLGIGVNATMFGVVDTLFLKPPAGISDPRGLVRITLHHSEGWTSATTSYPVFTDLRDHAGGFAYISAVTSRPMGMGRGLDAIEVDAMAVSHEFFPMLGLHPSLGRFFGAAEDRIGGDRVAVLGYRFWQTHFASDANVVGRTLPLGQGTYTVIGVGPKDFTGINLNPTDIFVPIVPAAASGDIVDATALSSRDWQWMQMIARVKPATTSAAAAAAATLAFRTGGRVADQPPDTLGEVLLGPIQEARGPEESGDAKVAAWIAGVALIVLLIACANIANLLLARGVSRRRELAVRASLGAGRAGLIRMLLAESAVLAVGGGTLAVVLAIWVGGMARGILLPEFPADAPVVDLRVLLFTGLAVFVTVVLVGLVPALYASRTNLVEALKRGGHGTTSHGSTTRTTLLIAQIALTLTLLVGAGLFVRSLQRAKAIDLGLDAEHLISVTISRSGRDRIESNDAYLRLIDRLQRLPGVVSAAVTMGSPFRWAYADALRAEGRDSMPRSPGGGPYFQAVTPSYLATMGTRIITGRDFNVGDTPGSARVAIIGATFAKRLWPQENPLGKCLYVGDSTAPCTQVVGVAADAKRGQLTESEAFLYYLPFAQRKDADISEAFVRTRGPSRAMVGAVAREARTMSTLPYVEVEAFMDRVTPQLWSWQLGAMAFTAFGLLALVIAATGVFAVLSYSVSQRTKEVGLRVALGAQRGDVVRLVVAQGLRAAAIGVVLGGLGAYLLGHAIAKLLYRVPPTDALILTVAPIVLLTVAAAAAYLPARRAAAVDPMVALRAE